MAGALGTVAMIAEEIIYTWAKLDRAGVGSGGRGDEAPLPVRTDARTKWDAAVRDIIRWAELVDEGRALPAPGRLWEPYEREPRRVFVASGRSLRYRIELTLERRRHPLEVAASWLTPHLGWLRRLDVARMAMPELLAAAGELVSIVDRRPDRWYAGPCGARELVVGEGGELATVECPEMLRPKHGVAVIRCRCGAEHDAAARRAWLLGALDDEWCTAAEIVLILAALDGVRVPEGNIRVWAHRGRLMPHPDREPGDRPRYRVGSVRDILAQDYARRAERDAKRAARAAKRTEREEINA